jgi:outer membrane protein assembly factor BamB
LSTVAIHDGVMYFCDLTGIFRAMDPETGKVIWDHDILSAVWGSPYVVDGMVYLGDEDGEVVVFKAAPKKEVLFETNMGNSVYSTPIAANGVLYIATRDRLYALQEGASSDPEKVN